MIENGSNGESIIAGPGTITFASDFCFEGFFVTKPVIGAWKSGSTFGIYVVYRAAAVYLQMVWDWLALNSRDGFD